MAQYTSPFLIAGGSKSSSGSGKGKYTSPFSSVRAAAIKHHKDLAKVDYSQYLQAPQGGGGSAPAKKSGGSSLLSKAGHLVKDVAAGVVEAPAWFIKTDIINPLKETAAQVTGNKLAERNAIAASREHLSGSKTGTGRDAIKKLAGETALLGSLFVGGASGATLKTAAKSGFKTLARKSAPVIASGAAGGGGYTVAKNPKASAKDIATGGAFGAGLSLLAPAAGAFLARGAKAVRGAPKGVHVNANGADIGTPALHLPDKGIYAKLTKEQQLHLSDEINNIPASAGDVPHLTQLDILQKSKHKEVPLDKLLAQSKNAQKAIAGTDKKIQGAALAQEKSILAKLPQVQEGNTGQAVLNRKFVVDKYHDLLKPVKEAAKGMSEKDKQLLDRIEIPKTNIKITPGLATRRVAAVAKKADNPEQFMKVAGEMRNAYNTRLAGDITLGREVGFRHNYLPHMFDTSDTKTRTILNKIEQRNAKLSAASKPGYTKSRTIETYAKAAELGLKRKNANALQDFEDAVNAAAYEHGSQALRLGLEQAHPGQVAVGKIGRNIATGDQYVQLHIPGGESISVPKDLADVINKRAPMVKATGVTGKYDEGNALLKYLKLGGGTFHALTETGSIGGQQISSGNLFKHPIANLRVIGGTLSRKMHDKNMARHEQSGLLDFARLSGTTIKPGEILADANLTSIDKMKNSRLNFIKNVHDMIFDRQIPEGKLLIMEQGMRQRFPDINFHAPTPGQIAHGRRIASAVNNLGGINRAVEGLTPKTAQKWSRLLLATDFTEGRFRTIGNALARGGPEGKIARQMVVGKSILFALPGLAALTMAGKLDPSDPAAVGKAFVAQVLDPKIISNFRSGPTKSNPGGVPKSIQLPRSFISEVGRVIAPALDNLNPDKWSGVKDYAHARLAALPSTAEAVATNADFFGNPLYGQDKKGNPISPGKAALNIAGQGAPIPAVQVSKAKQQTATESILNTAGFRVSNDKTSTEGKHTQAITDFFNTFNKTSDAKSKVSKRVTSLIQEGKVGEARRVADDWNHSIYSHISPFKEKYRTNYNPAWDKEFSRLVISVSDNAFKQRLRSSELNRAVLR